MNRKTLTTSIVSAILSIYLMSPALAGVEYTHTTVNFNIGAVDEVTVTLYGETAVTTAGGAGTATTSIEFNTSSGNEWINGSVCNGNTQDDTNGVINSIDNTGTTNCQLDISFINSTPLACSGPGGKDINFTYSTSWDDTAQKLATTSMVEAGNITLDASFTPAETAKEIWLFANFTGCVDADDNSGTFQIWATFA